MTSKRRGGESRESTSIRKSKSKKLKSKGKKKKEKIPEPPRRADTPPLAGEPDASVATRTPPKARPLTRLKEQMEATQKTLIAKNSTANSMPKTFIVKGTELRERVGDEIGPCIVEYDAAWADLNLKNLVDEGKIIAFFHDESTQTVYNKKTKRWKGLAPGLSDEKKLYLPLKHIASVVIKEVAGATVDRREVLIRDRKRMRHVEADPNCNHFTMPDVIVKGTGPSFEVPRLSHGRDVGYSNVAGIIEVKLDLSGGEENIRALVKQVGSYARQTAIQQPNRMYVRVLVVSSEECMLFHFDRSGVHYTPPFNIHQNPENFARAIASIGSLDENVLGLDTTIQWKIGKNGRKKSGRIVVIDAEKGATVYKLVNVDPEFQRFAIRGRGTTCWRAKVHIPTDQDDDTDSEDEEDSEDSESDTESDDESDDGSDGDSDDEGGSEDESGEDETGDSDGDDKNGKDDKEDTSDHVIIKYSWRSEGRVPEHEYLKEAKGMKGVAQMIGYGVDIHETRLLRNPSPNDKMADPEKFFNCVYSCVVLEGYRSSMLKCDDQLDLLCGLHDAMEGYRSLCEKLNIVHSDITPENILIGKQGRDSEEGYRGVLCDLDLAFKKDRTPDKVCKDPRSGNFMYMSISRLKTCIAKNPDLLAQQDGNDDLESIYYSLYDVMHSRNAFGKRISLETLEYQASWGGNVARHSCANKGYHFQELPSLEAVPHITWRSPAVEFLNNFYGVVKEFCMSKVNLGELTTDEKVEACIAINNQADGNFVKVIGFLKEAIDKMRPMDLGKPAPEEIELQASGDMIREVDDKEDYDEEEEILKMFAEPDDDDTGDEEDTPIPVVISAPVFSSPTASTSTAPLTLVPATLGAATASTSTAPSATVPATLGAGTIPIQGPAVILDSSSAVKRGAEDMDELPEVVENAEKRRRTNPVRASRVRKSGKSKLGG